MILSDTGVATVVPAVLDIRILASVDFWLFCYQLDLGLLDNFVVY